MSKLETVSIDDVSGDQWNEWVQSLQESNVNHLSELLGLYDAFKETDERRLSFAIFDGSGQLAAICPFSVHRTRIAERDIIEATFSGAPLALPAIRYSTATARRRLAREVYSLIDARCEAEGVQRIVFRRPGVVLGTVTDSRPINVLEILDFGYLCHAQSSVCIDLRKSDEELESLLTRKKRSSVRKTERLGVITRVFRGGEGAPTDEEMICECFDQYRHAHFVSAGRKTRPDKTWEMMLQWLLDGKATLYSAYLGDLPISFLFCSEFAGIATAGSQANVDEYERSHSPRHLLEWRAILDYSARGFAFYDMGTRFGPPSMFHLPSVKEVTISDFKERYGGDLWPEYTFERFYDLELQDSVFAERYQKLRASQSGIQAVS